MIIEECRECNGTGKIKKTACESCEGKGFTAAVEEQTDAPPETLLPGRPLEGEVGEMDVAARIRLRKILDRRKSHLDRITENLERENQVLSLIEDNTAESLRDTYHDAVELGLIRKEEGK